MNRIDELIQEFCPHGVRFTNVNSVLKKLPGVSGITKDTYVALGKYPVVNQAQNLIAAYSDDEDNLLPVSEYIVFGDHTRCIKWVDFAFVPGESGTLVFKVEGKVNAKYIYYAIKNLKIESRGYNRHWTVLREMQIPVPPIEVQREIVSILDKFTALEAELEAELEARKKQHEFYRNFLLTNRNSGKKFSLGDLCYSITTGKLDVNAKIDGGNYPFFTCDAKPYSIDTFAFDDEAILISGNGSQVGHINYYKGKFNAYQRTYVLTSFSPIVTVPYLLHSLKASFREYVGINSRKGSVPYITLPMLSAFTIQLPTLEEQAKATEMLDKLEALHGDSEIGIPAEIAARRKQYEYYRDKLLTFKELDAA